MAEFLGSVYADAELRTDKLERGVAKAKGQIKGVSDAMGNAGRKMVGVGNTLTRSVTLPIVALGALAVRTAIKFDKTMVNTFAVLGDTTEEIEEQMKSFARTLGRETAFSAIDAGDAMYYMASAGWNAGKIMKETEGILDLAAATQSELDFTTEMVIGTLGRFSKEGYGSAEIADILANAISGSQMTMQRFADYIPYAGAAATDFGWSLKEITAAGGLLANVYGPKMATAGRQLAAAFANVAKKGTGLNGVLKKYGVTFKEINPETHNLVEILTAFEGKTLSAKDKMEIFGSVGARAFGVLQTIGPKALRDLTKELDKSGTAEEMAEKQLNSLSGAFMQLGSTWETLLESFVAGDVGKILGKYVYKVVDLLNSFAGLGAETKVFIIKLAALAAAIGPVLTTLGYMSIGMGALLTPIGLVIISAAALASIIIGLAVAIKKTDLPGWAKTLLSGVLGPIGYLIINFDKLKKSFLSVAELFGYGQKTIVDKITSMADESVGKVVDMSNSIEYEFRTLAINLGTVTGNMAKDIIEKINLIKDEAIAGAKEQHSKTLKELKYLKDEAGAINDKMYDDLVKRANKKLKKQVKLHKQQAKLVIAEIEKLEEKGVKVTEEIKKKIIKKVQEQRDGAVMAMTDQKVKSLAILEELRAGQGSITLSMAQDMIKRSAEQRDAAINGANKTYQQTIEKIIRLRDEQGIIGAEKAQEMINNAKIERDGTVGEANLLHLSVVDEMKGMNSDIETNMDTHNGEMKSKWRIWADNAVIQVSEMALRIREWMRKTRDKIIQYVKDIYHRTIEWFKKLPGRVVAFIIRMKDRVSEKLGEMKDDALAAGKEFVENIIAGIKSKAGELWDAVKELLKLGKGSILMGGQTIVTTKEMMKVGSILMDTISKGINSDLGNLNSIMSSALSSPLQAQTATASPSVAQSSTVNNSPRIEVNIGMYAGTPMEKRKIGEELIGAFNDSMKAQGKPELGE